MDFPKMFLVKRKLEAPKINDVRGAILSQLKKLDLPSKIRPGMRIAVTAGSRGIANYVLMLSTVVAELKGIGAKPFLVPSMGSHGSATAEGQLEVLQSLGVTEESVGCPIISQMDVVQIGQTEQGIPVFLDKVAMSADGIVVVNRIKAHTEYEGDIESGLMKMMTIGLGKYKGCSTAHANAVKFGYRTVIPSIAREVLKRASILFGLASVENVYDEIAYIVALEPEQFEETERELLKEAKQLMPRLPVEQLDVIILSKMGKEISGSGMDTNVIGRRMVLSEPEPTSPRITRIVVLDITDATKGSAVGIGLADFTTRRLVNKLDYTAIYINCLAAMTPEKARIPVIGETDEQAIEWAFQTTGLLEYSNARVMSIKDTLHLDQFYVSKSLIPEIQEQPGLEIVKEPREMRFDSCGTLQLELD